MTSKAGITKSQYLFVLAWNVLPVLLFSLDKYYHIIIVIKTYFTFNCKVPFMKVEFLFIEGRLIGRKSHKRRIIRLRRVMRWIIRVRQIIGLNLKVERF